jgi:hypothetical protein
MGIRHYLIGISKVLVDLFGFFDVYSYFLSSLQFQEVLFLMPFAFLCDILVDFQLGTFILVDAFIILLINFLRKNTPIFRSAMWVYFFRYNIFYFLGLSLFSIINQLIFGIFLIFAIKGFRPLYKLFFK